MSQLKEKPGQSRWVVSWPIKRQARVAPEPAKIAGVSGVILAGGQSRRMGCDKSLLPIAGARFIEHVYRPLAGLFDEVIVVTNSPGLYTFLPCPLVPDLYPGRCSLIGIHSGLRQIRSEKAFVVACDMPFLRSEVIRLLCASKEEGDLVLPCGDQGVEPLHALYDRSCLPAIETAIESGEQRISSIFDQVQVHRVPMSALAQYDPKGESFRNINTPQEYFDLREGARSPEEKVHAGSRL